VNDEALTEARMSEPSLLLIGGGGISYPGDSRLFHVEYVQDEKYVLSL
jgi:hypothetical protein